MILTRQMSGETLRLISLLISAFHSVRVDQGMPLFLFTTVTRKLNLNAALKTISIVLVIAIELTSLQALAGGESDTKDLFEKCISPIETYLDSWGISVESEYTKKANLIENILPQGALLLRGAK